MALKILNETFTALGNSIRGDVVGTVTLDLGYGKTVVAKAYVSDFSGDLHVAGFIGRYVSSAKPWIAHVSGKGDRLFVSFGRDDRSGRFNKQNAISWQPELFEAMANIASWTPVEG